MTRMLIVAGTTRTAAIEGLSAAGASPTLRRRTPSADAEILTYGLPIGGGPVPVSPTGCVTPAVITRAAREMLGFPVTIVDAGLAVPTAAPTVDMSAEPGGSLTDPRPVPAAAELLERGREFGRALPDDRLYLGETIPGGTTTALGVLRALGEPGAVSSSLPDNPVALKRTVVTDGFEASGIEPGEAAGDPVLAIETMGDPMLAIAGGIVAGAVETGTEVVLAGGTQLVAVGAIVRQLGVTDPIELATTTFVARDRSIDLHESARAQRLSLTVTDPAFDESDRDSPPFDRYEAGEAKEGVGMGGAIEMVAAGPGSLDEFHDRIEAIVERLDGLPDRATFKPVEGR